MMPAWLGTNTAKITVNVWDFGPLGTAITPLQRGGFLTFANTLRADVCKYRPEVGKMKLLKNPKKIM